MQLPAPDAAFLVDCLTHVAVAAPCRARIEQVVQSVADGGASEACCIPDSIFVRSLAIGSILWSIDTGIVEPEANEQAQRVLDSLWHDGPIRPELIAAQLRCLVAQPAETSHCLWTCPAMAHANAGYNPQLGPEMRAVLPGLIGTVISEGADTLAVVRTDYGSTLSAPPRTPRSGTRVSCRSCGRDGTILGVDPEDGWTVVEHYPPVVQREDGMWAISPDASPGPHQCRYIVDRAELMLA
ncbi:MAG: hypothetical protein WCK58_09180 [Chloroflexota bacterium]